MGGRNRNTANGSASREDKRSMNGSTPQDGRNKRPTNGSAPQEGRDKRPTNGSAPREGRDKRPANGPAPREDRDERSANGSTSRECGSQNLADKTAPKGKAPGSKGLWPLCGFAYAVLLVIFEYFLEKSAAQTGEPSPWNVLSHEWTLYISVPTTIFSAFIQRITDKKWEEFLDTLTRPEGMSSWEHSWIFIKGVCKRYISHNTLFFITALIMGLLYVPAFAANQGFAYQILGSLLPGVTPSEAAVDEPSAEVSVLVPEASPMIEENMAVQEVEVEVVSEERLESLDKRLVLQSEMKYEVSDEELDEIFFRTEEYAIEDWFDDNEILNVVKQFVQDQRERPSAPDHDTDLEEDDLQNIFNSINYASEKEKKMLEDKEPTSNQLQEVIDLRVSAYDSYPFYKLAFVTRESFCMYGDAIQTQNGSDEDAAILFMKSITYGYSILQYDVSTAQFSKDLDTLSERFTKLSKSLVPDSDEHWQALQLAKAFKTLSLNLP